MRLCPKLVQKTCTLYAKKIVGGEITNMHEAHQFGIIARVQRAHKFGIITNMQREHYFGTIT